MKNLLLAVIGFVILQGCAGVSEKIVHAEDGMSYKMEEVYSIGLFTPTYQWKRTSRCQTVTEHVQSNPFGSGYDSKSIKDCAVIGGKDGFTNDTASPIGPALLQAGATVGTGALIKEGLEDSGDSINNSNSNSATGGAGGQGGAGGCAGWFCNKP